jgi:cytochrome c peroxidase
LIKNRFARALIGTCEQISNHDARGTQGQRLGHITRKFDAAIGDNGFAFFLGRARALDHSRDLWHSNASHHSRGADRTRSDSDFHNIGVGMTAKAPDLGREKETKNIAHRGAFKTPTLRTLGDTAPYMHDGSEKTLESVVDYYDKGGFLNLWRDKEMKFLGLTKAEKKDLVQFLKALNGDKMELESPKLP